MASKQRSESQPPANLGGRPSALKPEHIVALHEIVAEHAQANLEEIADELERPCGLRVYAAADGTPVPAHAATGTTKKL